MKRFKSDKNIYKDTDNIIEVLLEHFRHNDMDNFFIVLRAYIKNSNKLKLSNSTKLGRTSVYELLNNPNPENVQIGTISKIISHINKNHAA